MHGQGTSGANVAVKHAIARDYGSAGGGEPETADADAAEVQFVVGDGQSRQGSSGSGLQRDVNVSVIQEIATDLGVVEASIGNTGAVKHVVTDLHVFRQAREIVLAGFNASSVVQGRKTPLEDIGMNVKSRLRHD